eukprot:CAMPEP_0168626818 /NCGR_PEP_ID=MMETSP0449_2-20121227/10858_1 /TAXON_ID=1082188 /ORGANISM="Strombidium rassoulzadegani, Strain ras09" /LENGTH=175 /DNA_ID=CAMNT_0008668885 /DNA_START=201 /DNA_END=725 /DNA_ORIENTATION=-
MILAVSLLRNLAYRFSMDTDEYCFEYYFNLQMNQLRQYEGVIRRHNEGLRDSKMSRVRRGGNIKVVEGKLQPSVEIKQIKMMEPEEQIGLSYLIEQHRTEILDTMFDDYPMAVSQTLSEEFMKLVTSSLFVPFIHAETPQPLNMQPTPPKLIKPNSFIADFVNVLELFKVRENMG